MSYLDTAKFNFNINAEPYTCGIDNPANRVNWDCALKRSNISMRVHDVPVYPL